MDTPDYLFSSIGMAVPFVVGVGGLITNEVAGRPVDPAIIVRESAGLGGFITIPVRIVADMTTQTIQTVINNRRPN